MKSVGNEALTSVLGPTLVTHTNQRKNESFEREVVHWSTKGLIRGLSRKIIGAAGSHLGSEPSFGSPATSDTIHPPSDSHMSDVTDVAVRDRRRPI